MYILSHSNKALLRDGNYCYPCEGNVLIQVAAILGSDGDSFPKNFGPKTSLPHFVFDAKLVFLETSFDPISRIKRGKFYELSPDGQPEPLYPSTFGGVYEIHARNPQSSTTAYKFKSYDFTRAFNPRDAFIIFGNSRFETRWRILSIDASITNEEVCVLQEVNSIGAIPSLNINVIPSDHFAEIDKEFTALISELNAAPETVIDHCRDVATSLLSAIIGIDEKQNRIDLGKLILKLDENLKLIKSSAEIINRLHPRRKPNEQEKHGLPELTRNESDYAVQSVFQIIREMKWCLR